MDNGLNCELLLLDPLSLSLSLSPSSHYLNITSDIAMYNAAMLQTSDLVEAIKAFKTKSTPEFKDFPRMSGDGFEN